MKYFKKEKKVVDNYNQIFKAKERYRCFLRKAVHELERLFSSVHSYIIMSFSKDKIIIHVNSYLSPVIVNPIFDTFLDKWWTRNNRHREIDIKLINLYSHE